MNCYQAIELMGDELEGPLPAERRAGFDEHLVECSVCATYFAQLRTTVYALEHLPRPGLAPERRSKLIAAFQREWKRSR